MNIFTDDLKFSKVQSIREIWREAYQTCFPNLSQITWKDEDGPAQRAGVDCVVQFPWGISLKFDEKLRRRNKRTGEVYKDILLEEYSKYSSFGADTPGWMQKPLQCDYIGYANLPAGLGWFLPYPALKAYWDQTYHWRRNYTHRITAENESWRTSNFALSLKELQANVPEILDFVFSPVE